MKLREELVYHQDHQRKQLEYSDPNMNSFFETDYRVGLQFLHCLSRETVKKLGRNMVCNYCYNFKADKDNTMADKIVRGSLDRMGKFVVSTDNFCYNCTDSLQ